MITERAYFLGSVVVKKCNARPVYVLWSHLGASILILSFFFELDVISFSIVNTLSLYTVKILIQYFR